MPISDELKKKAKHHNDSVKANTKKPDISNKSKENKKHSIKSSNSRLSLEKLNNIEKYVFSSPNFREYWSNDLENLSEQVKRADNAKRNKPSLEATITTDSNDDTLKNTGYLSSIRNKIDELNNFDVPNYLKSLSINEIKDIQRNLADEGWYDEQLSGNKDDIKDIQMLLINKGYLPDTKNNEGNYVEADGIAGNKTKSAYINYLRNKNIDGLIGNRTISGYKNNVINRQINSLQNQYNSYISRAGQLNYDSSLPLDNLNINDIDINRPQNVSNSNSNVSNNSNESSLLDDIVMTGRIIANGIGRKYYEYFGAPNATESSKNIDIPIQYLDSTLVDPELIPDRLIWRNNESTNDDEENRNAYMSNYGPISEQDLDYYLLNDVDPNYLPTYTSNDTIKFKENIKDYALKNQYGLTGSYNLADYTFGIRNRGDYTPIESPDGGLITSFNPFIPYDNNKKDKNGSYIGIDKNGKFKVGSYSDFSEGDKLTRVYSNVIRNFVKDDNDKLQYKVKNAKLGHYNPKVTVVNPDGTTKVGSLNMFLGDGYNPNIYSGTRGGGIIVQCDDEIRLLTGSVQDVSNMFDEMQSRHEGKDMTVYIVDNGTYSKGLRKLDGNISSSDLKKYDAFNNSGGHFLYTKRNGGRKSLETL